MREKYLTLFLLQVGGGGDHLTVPGQDTCHGAVTLHPGTGHVTYATCAVDRPGHVPMSGAGARTRGCPRLCPPRTSTIRSTRRGFHSYILRYRY